MRHFIRSVKYLVALAIIFAAMMLLVGSTGQIKLSLQEQIDIFMANNGAMKMALLVVLAAIYPMFGFIKRSVDGTIVEYRQQIITAMQSSGFVFIEEREGVMIFRANNIFRRITFLFEDRVEVRQVGDMIQIEGVRRGVAYAAYCLDGFIQNSKRAEL